MAKNFSNLDRNRNSGDALDMITGSSNRDSNPIKKKEEKQFIIKLSSNWHSYLKFDLSKKYEMTMQELVMNALEQTYPELKEKAGPFTK